MDPLRTATLQQWINGKGNRAASELGTLLLSIGCDPNALIQAVESEQLAVEADELKQRLIALAARGLDLTAASAAVAELAEQQQNPDAVNPESPE